ncbi:MAG: serine hydrolase, partial [Planctomycetes bacterium]|nr:serine hydrolase [Planctomycetota bacterium]
DEDALAKAIDTVFAGYAKSLDPRTRAVIVVHRGKIVAERYADGFDRDTPLHGWSMAKSVVDALVGIRVGQGKLAVDEPVALDLWNDDRKITLDQMLRMTSGLAWSERYDRIDSDVTRMLFGVADASGFAASREVADEPGSLWDYSSGTTNVICRVLRSTFASLDDYHAFPHVSLFRRIGMNHAVIEPDAAGTFIGSSFVFATARDWARFGLLYLQDGVFAGQRILPEGWVAASTEPTAESPRGQYGRHWWLNAGLEDDGADRVYVDLPRDLFYASGHEGQVVAVVPSREAVIVRLGCTKISRSFRDGQFLKEVLDALPHATAR